MLLRLFPFVIPMWLIDRYAGDLGYLRLGSWFYFAMLFASLPWFIWQCIRLLRKRSRNQ